MGWIRTRCSTGRYHHGPGGAGGVGGDRAHGRQEHRRRGRVVAQLLEGRAPPAYAVAGAGPLGQRLAEVRELGEPGQRPGPVGDLVGRGGRRPRPPGRRTPRGPRTRSGRAPPTRRRASSSVSFSTAHAPAAGSATRPRWDSASSRLEVLRAIRRENSSGSPSGLSNGHHGDRVGPADARGEGGDGGAEHVDPGVVLAHHRPAGDRVDRAARPARPRSAPAPGPRAGGPRGAWRSSRTGRRWRRAAARPARRPR